MFGAMREVFCSLVGANMRFALAGGRTIFGAIRNDVTALRIHPNIGR